MGVSIRFSKRRGPASKVGGTLFFGLFLLMGLGFTVGFTWDLVNTIRTWTWPQVPCTILSSGVRQEKDEDPYAFLVRYRYEHDGRTYESDRYRRNAYSSGDYADVQRLLEKYAADSPARCHVNPGDPTYAVLETESAWHFPFVLIPLVFVAVGGGGIYATWRMPRPTSMTGRAGSRELTPKGQLAICSLFLLIGLGLAIGFGRWAWTLYAAQSWPEVPCVVLSSTVRAHRGDDSTTYSIDILYRYEFNGREYKSNRYSTFGGSSSGRAGKQEVVDRHPPGAEAVCYVDPSDPSYAMLHRGWSGEMFLVLLPLPFILLGGLGVVATLRKMRAPPAAKTDAAARAPERRTTATGDDGSVTLSASASPRAKLTFALLFATFWNGIVSIFVFFAVDSWRTGNPEYVLTVFLIPFVLVGLGTLGWVVHSVLSLFNPRLTVVLSRGDVRLGESADVRWSFDGRIDRIDRLRVTLEGAEHATYTTTDSKGKRSSTTATHRFAEIVLLETQNPRTIQSGSATLAIPADTMHTWSGGDNAIRWTLTICGEIPKWPDVKQEYELRVLPMPLPQAVAYDQEVAP